jgi:hypothetical protein
LTDKDATNNESLRELLSPDVANWWRQVGDYLLYD